jgi:hypothetical protein
MAGLELRREFVPSGIHRAIDHVAVLRLQTQRLERQLERGGGVNTADLLSHMRDELRTLAELTEILMACRDGADHTQG